MSGSNTLCNASNSSAQLRQKADQCRRALNRSEAKKKYRHNWMKCIDRYRVIYTRYPESEDAVWALYHSGRLYTSLSIYSGRSKDLDEALSLYQTVVNEYPDHRLADDAQYLIGDIYFKRKGDILRGYIEYLKIEVKFPSGDMLPKARKLVDELANRLSKKDRARAKSMTIDTKPKLAAVQDIRHWSTPNYTRVVVDLDRPVKYEHHLLKADLELNKPRRLYMDLKKTRVTSEIESQIPIRDGLLQRARAGQYTKDTTRVVLDIESLGGYKVFHLYDPFRIVVDVRRFEQDKTQLTTKPVIKKRPVQKGIKRADIPENGASLAIQLGLNVKKIVIDPGHGGKDPGCRHPSNIQEKDIVLSIAKMLAEKLKDEIGCEVILTRTNDVYLSLEQRTAIANMNKADLFISLHVNAHKNKDIKGLETYFLNMTTDEASVLVAARENATSEKNISDLQSILNDLMLNTKIYESSRLANEVQNGMVSHISKKYSTIKNLGVKQAPFYVMIGAEMPAILVEVGFLTNSMERKRLVNRTYHKRLAEGISNGIKEYITSINQVYQGG